MSEPESESEGQAGTEAELKPEAEPEVRTEPEPEPEWSVALDAWGSAWDLHVYFFATAFLLMAIISVYSMCYFVKKRRAVKQGALTLSLQSLLLFFSTFRFLVLYIDPYHGEAKVAPEFFMFVWPLAQPGLTASFSVLLLAILDTTKMTLGPPRFQNLTTILSFTAAHFGIVIVFHAITLGCAKCTFLLFVCQVIFILYGLVLGFGYLYCSYAINKHCAAGTTNVEENKKIKRLIATAGISSFVSFSIAVTYIYTASSDFGIYSDAIFVDAWDWLILQTVLRTEEVASCFLVLTIAFRNSSETCKNCLTKIQKRCSTKVDVTKKNSLNFQNSPSTVNTFNVTDTNFEKNAIKSNKSMF